MPASVTILGSGTSAGVPMIGCDCDVCGSDDPRDTRTRPALLVRVPDPEADAETDPDGYHAGFNRDQAGVRQYVIDTGPDFRDQALRERLSRVDGVLYTHTHVDHVFGLDELRRFTAVSGDPVPLYAEPEALASLRTTYRYVFDPESNPNTSFVPRLEPRPIEAHAAFELPGGLRVEPLRLLHGRQPVLGFRFELPDGTAFAYCTDCSEIPAAAESRLQDLDLLVLDGLRPRPHPTHLSTAEAVDIIRQTGARRGLLTHLAHDVGHAELSRQLPTPIAPAFDGLTVTLTPEEASA